MRAAGVRGGAKTKASAPKARPSTTPAPKLNGEAPDKLVIDTREPYAVAKLFREVQFTRDGIATLHHHRGHFYRWDGGGSYLALSETELRPALYEFLTGCVAHGAKGALRPIKPNAVMVSSLLDALRAAAHLAAVISAPVWLDQVPDLDPADIVACANGLLHLPTRELLPHTPSFFTFNAIDVAYQPKAPQPAAWIAFLQQIFAPPAGDTGDYVGPLPPLPKEPDFADIAGRGSDPLAIWALQEMFGYFLTPDTRQQKMFLIVGPKRSGKGTIARVLTRLVGINSTVAPTLTGLSMPFGLMPLIDKRVAIISDARLSNRADQHAIAERLLSITGEDAMTIDRKYSDAWTGRLQTRFLILSNELPRLADASGALASRFIVQQLRQSFYGREDPGLADKLLAELPGILNWAIAGLARLRTRRHFVQPPSGAEAVREIEELGSPIATFLRDRCDIDPGRSIQVDELWKAWKEWCQDQGRDRPGTKQGFGRDLRAALPGLKVVQPREGSSRYRVYGGVGLKW
jgi:putative DNA primase/helicase